VARVRVLAVVGEILGAGRAAGREHEGGARAGARDCSSSTGGSGGAAAAVERRAHGGGCGGAAGALRARAGEDGVARLRAGAHGGGGAAAWREKHGRGESAKSVALRISEYGRRQMKKKMDRDPTERLKRMRSAFL
jgi:hypothetical protein